MWTMSVGNSLEISINNRPGIGMDEAGLSIKLESVVS